MTADGYELVLRALRERRDECLAKTRNYEAAIKMVEGLAREVLETSGSSPGPLAGMTRANAAYTVLAEHGRPLPTRELVRLLQERGFEVAATNWQDSIRSAMRRDPDRRFCRTRQRGRPWALSKWEELRTASEDDEFEGERAHALEMVGSS